MSDAHLVGPWIRRFLLEYVVSECNLARNTQCSYRDTLRLLLPFAALQLKKEVDQISVIDLSGEVVRLFLQHVEESRKCGITTRNHDWPRSTHWHASSVCVVPSTSSGAARSEQSHRNERLDHYHLS
jgi:site-specific recombinase XerD